MLARARSARTNDPRGLIYEIISPQDNLSLVLVTECD